MTYLESVVLNKPVFLCTPETMLVLSHREAVAASPEDFLVCGEEDPGEGLEFLVAGNTNNCA